MQVSTLLDICREYEATRFDLLMIDTEGYDFEIIKSIPFDKIDIDTIIWEHSHLIAETQEYSHVFLENKGYSITKCDSDTIAQKNK